MDIREWARKDSSDDYDYYDDPTIHEIARGIVLDFLHTPENAKFLTDMKFRRRVIDMAHKVARTIRERILEEKE
jgi:hypothetical protein